MRPADRDLGLTQLRRDAGRSALCRPCGLNDGSGQGLRFTALGPVRLEQGTIGLFAMTRKEISAARDRLELHPGLIEEIVVADRLIFLLGIEPAVQISPCGAPLRIDHLEVIEIESGRQEAVTGSVLEPGPMNGRLGAKRAIEDGK